jgi:CheY-like chemotaxis protein
VGSESAKVNNVNVQNSVKKQGTLSLKLHEYAGLLAGSTVLVAEDNLINQQVVCEFLKLSDINVGVAKTGLEVLALLERHTYDAILMDVNMPEMGGLEATTEIRSKEIYANLPIIALTAGVTSEEQQKCLDIGMNYFIRKPVNPEELIRVLCQAIHPNSSEFNG